MFVLFDSVWDPYPEARQAAAAEAAPPQLRLGAGPGAEVLARPAPVDKLRGVRRGRHGRFKDKRSRPGTSWNEPDNRARNYAKPAEEQGANGRRLLTKAYAWAREANPMQPLTSGVWIGNWGDPGKLTAVERFHLDESDVTQLPQLRSSTMKKCVQNLRRYDRPSSVRSTWPAPTAARSTRCSRT